LGPDGQRLIITDVRTKILRASLDEGIGMSFGRLNQRAMALIEIEAESGLIGYGEGWINYPHWAAEERVLAMREGLAPLLVGEDAFCINKIHLRLTDALVPMGTQWGASGPIAQAISGVDLALWDLDECCGDFRPTAP
jgi:L-alanine-DL-glutamate epimerase-like enolase superfamily enzyme